jgi:hypothetical protein
MTRAILFLTILLLSLSTAWAYQPIDLSLHGSNLKKASFVIRYKFEQKTRKNWQSSTYVEREKFLTEWYAEQKEKDKKLRLEEKEDARKERELEKSKKTERKRLANLEKSNARVMKEEHKSKKILKKNVDHNFKQMEKELKMLQRSK